METWEKWGGHSCEIAFDFSQLQVPLTHSCLAHHLLVPDLREFRSVWEEALKGYGEGSLVVEHAVFTARVFSHTHPVKNLGPSRTNYSFCYSEVKGGAMCPAGARLLLGPWQMHLAQRHSTKRSSSAPSRCVASFTVASAHATWQLPVRWPNAHFPRGLRAWNSSSMISYLYLSSWCLKGISDKWWGTTL